MKTIHIKQVDAFCGKTFSGNPAGVVLDAEGLTDQEMQSIARELNNPETAFILKPTLPEADIQIRWFIPKEEVPLCGHATIAGFHALAESSLAGMKSNGQHYFQLQTRSGLLAVRVETNFHGIGVELELPKPNFKIKKTISRQLLSSLTLKPADLDKKLPVVSDTYLYIPIKHRERVHRLKPDFSRLAQLCTSANFLGVCVFTLDTIERTSAVHSRFFAPSCGIDEDPVTGSANGPLGVYLYQFVRPTGTALAVKELTDGRIEYIGEQGDVLDRPGRVHIRLRCKHDAVDDVSIGGEALTVFETTLSLK